MTTLADVRAGLAALVASLTALPAAMIVWEDQQRPFMDPSVRAIATLSFGPITPQGRDEVISVWDANNPGAEYRDTVKGIRTLPWRIKVESLEQTNDKTAQNYLERARTRLRLPDSIAALNAVSCSRQSTGQVIPVQEGVDKRIASIAVLDVLLNCALTETAAQGYGYIATVEGTDLRGNPYTLPVN